MSSLSSTWQKTVPLSNHSCLNSRVCCRWMMVRLLQRVWIPAKMTAEPSRWRSWWRRWHVSGKSWKIKIKSSHGSLINSIRNRQWDATVISISLGSEVRGEHIMINPLRRCGDHPIITLLLYLLLSSLPGSASTRLHLVPACLNADKPQILQPISRIPNEPLIQGKLARTVPIGGRSDACTGGEQPPMPCPPSPCAHPILPPARDPRVESKSLPDPEEMSRLLSTHLRIQDINECDSPGAGEQIARPTPESHQNKLLQTPHPLSLFSPRVLQPPRLHRRVTLSALPVGGCSRSNPKSRLSVNYKAQQQQQQLPPSPSRGLPCFSAENHIILHGQPSQAWPVVIRREANPEHNASVSLGISTRLPKPKIHWVSAAAIDTDKATSLNAWLHMRLALDGVFCG